MGQAAAKIAASGVAGVFVPPESQSPGERQTAAITRTLADLVAGVAMVEEAQAATAIAFECHDDAVRVRDLTAANLDRVAETAPDSLFRALTDLRIFVVRTITALGTDLARIAHVTPLRTEPALVLAWRVYADAGREIDLLLRNRHIRHPGFVPGGVPLEVLVNG